MSLQEEFRKQQQIRAQQQFNKEQPPPSSGMTRINIPFDIDEVLSIDEEMIGMLLTYKQKLKQIRDNRWEDKIAEMKSKSGPSREAKELVSFVYDRMDQFEKVLSEEEFDELESLIMNVK